MKCPFCANLEIQVAETRISEDADFIRRSQCGACEKPFITYERPDVTFMAIVKKDGRHIRENRSAPAKKKSRSPVWATVACIRFASVHRSFKDIDSKRPGNTS